VLRFNGRGLILELDTQDREKSVVLQSRQCCVTQITRFQPG
jgi:hypothetical protein